MASISSQTSFRHLTATDKSTPAAVYLSAWCPTMDLVAVATREGELSLHRLNWQKLWTVETGSLKLLSPDPLPLGALGPSTGEADAVRAANGPKDLRAAGENAPPASIPPPASTQRRVSALAWRLDGKVIAVGHDDSTLLLLNAENGKVCFSSEYTHPLWALNTTLSAKPSAITSLEWTYLTDQHHPAEGSSTDPLAPPPQAASNPRAKASFPASSFLLPNPTSLLNLALDGVDDKLSSTLKAFPVISALTETAAEFPAADNPTSVEKLLSPASAQPMILSVGHASGKVSLFVQGVFPIGSIQLDDAVCRASLSPNLSVLSVVTLSNVSAPAADTASDVGMPLIANSAVDPLFGGLDAAACSASLALATPQILAARRHEIRELAQRYLQCCILEWHILEAHHQMTEAWGSPLAELTELLAKFSSSHHQGQGLTESFESAVVAAIATGSSNPNLGEFFTSSLSPPLLRAVRNSLSNGFLEVKALLLNHVQPAAQLLLGHCSDLLGHARWYERYGPLGLSEHAVRRLLYQATALLLKTDEFFAEANVWYTNMIAAVDWLLLMVELTKDQSLLFHEALGRIDFKLTSLVDSFLRSHLKSMPRRIELALEAKRQPGASGSAANEPQQEAGMEAEHEGREEEEQAEEEVWDWTKPAAGTRGGGSGKAAASHTAPGPRYPLEAHFTYDKVKAYLSGDRLLFTSALNEASDSASAIIQQHLVHSTLGPSSSTAAAEERESYKTQTLKSLVHAIAQCRHRLVSKIHSVCSEQVHLTYRLPLFSIPPDDASRPSPVDSSERFYRVCRSMFTCSRLFQQPERASRAGQRRDTASVFSVRKPAPPVSAPHAFLVFHPLNFARDEGITHDEIWVVQYPTSKLSAGSDSRKGEGSLFWSPPDAQAWQVCVDSYALDIDTPDAHSVLALQDYSDELAAFLVVRASADGSGAAPAVHLGLLSALKNSLDADAAEDNAPAGLASFRALAAVRDEAGAGVVPLVNSVSTLCPAFEIRPCIELVAEARELVKFKASLIAVSGTRRVASAFTASRKVRLFDLNASEDAEDGEEGDGADPDEDDDAVDGDTDAQESSSAIAADNGDAHPANQAPGVPTDSSFLSGDPDNNDSELFSLRRQSSDNDVSMESADGMQM